MILDPENLPDTLETGVYRFKGAEKFTLKLNNMWDEISVSTNRSTEIYKADLEAMPLREHLSAILYAIKLYNQGFSDGKAEGYYEGNPWEA